jgi:hypothetical protein
MNEIERLIYRSWGWAVEDAPVRAGRLSKDEVAQLTHRDAEYGVAGRPLMFSAPTQDKDFKMNRTCLFGSAK